MLKKMIFAAFILALVLTGGCSEKKPETVPAEELVNVIIDETESSGPAQSAAVQNPAQPSTENEQEVPEELPLSADDPERHVPVPEKLAKAQSKNSDVVGWLTVPNTRIDYPVVIAADNEYYLEHNIDKRKSKSGAIYIDYRNADEKQRRHIVVYGHNMKSGSMFHDLNNFKLKDFFNNTRTVDLWLWGEKLQFEVYSQYIATTDIDIIRTDFANDDEFLAYMDELKTQSKFPTNIKFKPDDVVLSLVTCTYEYDNSRCVVQGLLKPVSQT